MKNEEQELKGEEQNLRWALDETPYKDLTIEEFLLMRKYCETLKEDWVWDWDDWNHYERHGIHYFDKVQEYLDPTCCPDPEDQKPEDNVCFDAVPLPTPIQWLKKSEGRYHLWYDGEMWCTHDGDPEETWVFRHSNPSYACFQAHAHTEED